MKIVHVCAKNLQLFEDIIAGTGYKINGFQSAVQLESTLSRFNARDVLGLVIYQKHMTKGSLHLMRTFDAMFTFAPKPIIIVCDDAKEISKTKMFSMHHCTIYPLNSVDGTISDKDLNRIFTTLACLGDDMYDLSAIEQKNPESSDSTDTQSDGPVYIMDELENIYKNLRR